MIICIVQFLYAIVLRAPTDNKQLFASEGATLSGIYQSIKVILLECWMLKMTSNSFYVVDAV